VVNIIVLWNTLYRCSDLRTYGRPLTNIAWSPLGFPENIGTVQLTLAENKLTFR
jgi:hypothetical protein